MFYLDPVIFLTVFILVNGLVFYSFADDKRKAGDKQWRTPENTLLMWAFFGPFGAYAAMKIFHHKTRKTKFFLVPVFLALQLVVIIFLLFL